MNTKKTLQNCLEATSNDYSRLEEIYRSRTGSELVRDPYASVYAPLADISLSASVIVPAFKSRDTIEQCLRAIEQNSFNRKYPGQLEVVVVDDGSGDGTWELLGQLTTLRLRLKVVQQDHHGAAHARNTALKYAEGDVIICCDSDIILTPFCIEELMKRHQVLDNVLLMGFRGHWSRLDPRFQVAQLTRNLPDFLPPFADDFRVAHPLISVSRSLNHLKDWGNGKQLFLPVVPWMDLPQLVWGALFSLRRSDFLALGGFNEDFQGWGFEDTLVGVQAFVQGNFIVPVYAATGLHVEHPDRLPDKGGGYTYNYHVLQSVLHAPLVEEPARWLQRKTGQIGRYFERMHFEAAEDADDRIFLRAFDEVLADPRRYGEYFYEAGEYRKAIEVLSRCESGNSQANLVMAKALRADGRPEEALERLQESVAQAPEQTEPLIELALTLAALGRFDEAARLLPQLKQSKSLHPFTPVMSRFILDVPAYLHRETAQLYAHQEDYAVALQAVEMGLICEPRDLLAQAERARLLARLKRDSAAQAASESIMQSEVAKCIDVTLTQKAWPHLVAREYEQAVSLLESTRVLHPDNALLAQVTRDVQEALTRERPLPLAAEIIAQSRKIPGDFTSEELGLLVALTFLVLSRYDAHTPATLVEIGSFCGQATITIGLAIRALGRVHTRLIAVDKPRKAGPDKRLPWPERDMIMPARARLNKYRKDVYRLSDVIVCSPEEGLVPWDSGICQLLVNRQEDYQLFWLDVENVAIGGLVLLHQIETSPEGRDLVKELVEQAPFRVIARVGNLLALERVE